MQAAAFNAHSDSSIAYIMLRFGCKVCSSARISHVAVKAKSRTFSSFFTKGPDGYVVICICLCSDTDVRMTLCADLNSTQWIDSDYNYVCFACCP